MTATPPAGDTSPFREWWLYAWGGANVAVGATSLLIPLYVVQRGGGAFALGLLWFATSIAMVPGALGVGRLVDRTGRCRPYALAALGGSAVSLAAIPFLSSIPLILVTDGVLWLFVSSATPVFTLLVLSDVPEREWNSRIAVLSSYQGYGWTGGLLLGAVWTRALAGRLPPVDVQRSLLGVCVGLLAASTVAAARWLPDEEVPPEETHEDAASPSRSRRVGQATRLLLSPMLPGSLVSLARETDTDRVLRSLRGPLGVYFVAVTLFFAGFSLFTAPLPDFLTGAGFGDDAIFVLYVVSSLASAVFYASAGRLAGKYDVRLLQSGALGVRALSFPAVAIAGYALPTGTLTGLLGVGAAFAVTGLSWAVIAVTANTLVARLASERRRGAALGVYTAISGGAGAVGGLAGGWLATTAGYVWTFASAAALVFVGMAVVLALERLTRRPEPAG